MMHKTLQRCAYILSVFSKDRAYQHLCRFWNISSADVYRCIFMKNYVSGLCISIQEPRKRKLLNSSSFVSMFYVSLLSFKKASFTDSQASSTYAPMNSISFTEKHFKTRYSSHFVSVSFGHHLSCSSCILAQSTLQKCPGNIDKLKVSEKTSSCHFQISNRQT